MAKYDDLHCRRHTVNNTVLPPARSQVTSLREGSDESFHTYRTRDSSFPDDQIPPENVHSQTARLLMN